MRTASMFKAMSISEAGTVKKYWVTVCWVWALNSPPREAMIVESWAEERPGAAAEHHVLQGMGRAGKALRRLVSA